MAEQHEHILVVDDNEDVRYVLIRRLKRLGFERISIAENGEEALAAIDAQQFDLVLLDIMMPRVSGYDVLQRLRDEQKLADLPVIVVSALDDLDSAAKCIEIGAEDYLTKPVNATLLEARIGATLEKKRLRDKVGQQLAFIREAFGKYVPDSVVDSIMADGGSLQPIKTEATILYSDLADFTRIAEALTPEGVVQMLNEYFEAVIEPIIEHGGTVNQFQGDAMLVTFNVPLADARHADNAIRAAAGMQAAHHGRVFGGVALKTRIGINTGEIVAGNVGAGHRVNYTVHGDAVNLAARLEQLNKQYGTDVLISDSTASLLDDASLLTSVGEADIRGRSIPVELFRLAEK